MKIRSYLQLCRAHTTALETVPAYIGAVLATGVLLSIDALLWLVFGVLYHLIGYGMNSYMDWVNGYDTDDPHKADHPLNAGRLSPDTAKLFLGILLPIGVIYTIWLLNNLAGYVVFLVTIVFGVLYNTLGKQTEYKFIFISIAHTGVFVLPYISLGGEIFKLEFIIGVMYMLLWLTFQIGLSGDIKDITMDEENFVTQLGASSYEKYITFSSYVRYYSFVLKTITILTALVIPLYTMNTFGILSISLVAIPLFHSLSILVSSGYFDRQHRVKHMSLIEGYTATIFVLMYSHVLGIIASIAIIALSFISVIVGNKYLWGTFIAPKV